MRLVPLVLLLSTLATAGFGQEILRIAVYNVGLDRKGPGLLLKDIQEQDAPVLALAEIISRVKPDILLITAFDNDYRDLAIGGFRDVIAQAGAEYPYFFADPGNAGLPSGIDLNSNGRLGDWADNWGFGRFEGNKGMALLSRYPVSLDDVRRFNRTPWNYRRLSSRGHFDVPVVLPDGQVLHLLLSYPTPPVFDGPDDMNGLRNDAEIRFWVDYLNGETMRDDQGRNASFEAGLFAVVGSLNADPMDGDGLGVALAALLGHALITDPQPQSIGASAAEQGGLNALQQGDPRYDTADWNDDSTGNLRVDYVLPSTNLTVVDSGVFWPEQDDLLEQAETAHRLVWVDAAMP